MATQTLAAPTRIVRGAPYVTGINFLHVAERDQDQLVEGVVAAARAMTAQPGYVAANVLRSTDGSRVATYAQWADGATWDAAHRAIEARRLTDGYRRLVRNDAVPRLYDVVYTDDRSPEGVSVVSAGYRGAIFVNEITTQPETQDRLLRLVIANNEAQSQHTPGYRSANFHMSRDGRRAVNYSLWDTEEQAIAAISAMADEDVNLEERLAIAAPDFRFYTVAYAAHA
jgi:heme-degrading monooxygenase HmoA